MKIAVYTIALNEEKHVDRWFQSAKDADLLLIADTGSSDGTKQVAKTLGIKVYDIRVTPWRFDVARNKSLDLIPEDYDLCIQLDMDEVLLPGWRNKLEQAWNSGNKWPIYREITARNSDGSVLNFYHHFRIHPRQGVIWKYPIHEIVALKEGFQYHREFVDVEIEHLQDPNKSRSSYLHLLELAVMGMPHDWRMHHYLTREYWYRKDWQNLLLSSINAMKIYNGWDVERASTCIWASEAAYNLGYKDWSVEWAERATKEAPDFYEAWHWHSHICHLLELWQECFHSASKILILEKHTHHLVKPEIWKWWGYDLLALSAHYLGKNNIAILYGSKAVQGSPNDVRLQKNLEFYNAAGKQK